MPGTFNPTSAMLMVGPRIAEAMAALRPDDFESLAYHFVAAGERVRAIEYSYRAAQRAQAVYAYEEAAKYLDTALTKEQIAEFIQIPPR